MSERVRVTILGSTGSIGTQALDVIRAAGDRFEVVGLSAGGSQPDLLAQQAAEFGVARVATGTAETIELAAEDTDVVLNAVSGSQGLRATLAALDADHTIALANKESLVAGGPLVTSRAKPGQIRPVDSEHSALAQCLRSGAADEVRKLVVTASGGPFRGKTRAELQHVTPQQALAHPTWDMGRLVTTNSATLVNKGLEVIEAHLLFGIPYERIEVVVHPQSLVHSMVEFADGSTIAQVSPPDMRLPIAYALGWPERVPGAAAAMDWTTAQQFTFEPLDDAAFPSVALARRAGKAGGCAPAVYNAANEALVEAFHAGSIGFLQIVDTLADVVAEWLSEHSAASGPPSTVEDVEAADRWARQRALALTQPDH